MSDLCRKCTNLSFFEHQDPEDGREYFCSKNHEYINIGRDAYPDSYPRDYGCHLFVERVESFMRYATVCSGVEAMSLGVHAAGLPSTWTPVFFSEIEPFPCAVLANHFPNVPNLGDMTKIDGKAWRGKIDLLAGGTPCQGFSVAGRQEGLADDRSCLAMDYVKLLRDIEPTWIIWENVKGCFSTGTTKGEDFARFLSDLTGCKIEAPKKGWRNSGVIKADVEAGRPVWSLAWRVLDARFTKTCSFPGAIPQRRERVWVVGYLGDDESIAEKVLFECESLPRDIIKSETQGDHTPSRPRTSVGASCYRESDFGGFTQDNNASGTMTLKTSKGAYEEIIMQACCFREGAFGGFRPTNVGGTIKAKGGFVYGAESLIATFAPQGFGNFQASNVAGTVTGDHDNRIMGNTAALTCYALAENIIDRSEMSGSNGIGVKENEAYTLLRQGIAQGVACIPISMQNAQRKGDETRSALGIGKDGDCCPTITTAHHHAIALLDDQGGSQISISKGVSPTLRANVNGHQPLVPYMNIIRRLIPRECERLMGFLDDWTLVPYRGKLAVDTPRYKACGNSWAVNCAEWVVECINIVNNQLKERK